MNKRNHTLQREYYGDYYCYHPDGTLMFLTSERRAEWYLTNDVCEQDPADPKRLVFKHTPKGYGHWGTHLHEYWLKPKKNQCVVCGTKHDLTQHHVLPITLQRHYPNRSEDAGLRYHDMLLLCFDCHNEYEQKHAHAVYTKWERELDAVRHPQYKMDHKLAGAVKRARSILANRLPWEVQRKLVTEISDLLDIPKDEVNLKKLACLRHKDTQVLIRDADFGEKVCAEWDLGDLRRFWRKHFVDSMKPRFLPEGWSIDAPVEKTPTYK